MKTYEVTMTYEYTTYADKNDIINYLINTWGMTEEEAQKSFEKLSVSDIEEIIVGSGKWDPLEVDDLYYRESNMNIYDL